MTENKMKLAAIISAALSVAGLSLLILHSAIACKKGGAGDA
jgi:hypothetical protein